LTLRLHISLKIVHGNTPVKYKKRGLVNLSVQKSDLLSDYL